MFVQCLQTCLSNGWRHVYPMFDHMFTQCLNTCLPNVWRYVYYTFEDLDIDSLSQIPTEEVRDDDNKCNTGNSEAVKASIGHIVEDLTEEVAEIESPIENNEGGDEQDCHNNQKHEKANLPEYF